MPLNSLCALTVVALLVAVPPARARGPVPSSRYMGGPAELVTVPNGGSAGAILEGEDQVFNVPKPHGRMLHVDPCEIEADQANQFSRLDFGAARAVQVCSPRFRTKEQRSTDYLGNC